MSIEPIFTLLALEPIGIPPYSSRGITQTLTPIAAAAQLRRTVNGALLDLSAPQFRKYASQVTCSDQAPPAFDGLWQGAIVQVDCVARLAFKTDGGLPERAAVAGTELVEGDFTYYRPRLTMRITNFSTQEDEWGAAVGWTLDLEEV